ncbi:MAG: DUF3489 domain-containing protein [Candidatus Saccharibacteria bacterium]|nr:DUF3489 domain-containing protein [Pseudorhodobacter sp.]
MKKSTKSAAAVEAQDATPSPTLSKLDQMLSLLGQPQGASLADLCTATGWQTHSVRGALAGSLKRKGHVVISDKVDGVRRYRVGVQA